MVASYDSLSLEVVPLSAVFSTSGLTAGPEDARKLQQLLSTTTTLTSREDLIAYLRAQMLIRVANHHK